MPEVKAPDIAALPEEWQQWFAHSFREHRSQHHHCDMGDVPHYVPVPGFGGYYTCDVQLPIAEKDYDTTLTLVEPGYLYVDEIMDAATGVGFEILHYKDGSMAFKHPCTVTDRVLMIVAPRMPQKRGKKGPGWTINWKFKQGITINPSIICEGCGRHGHVIDGRWWPTCPVRHYENKGRSILELDPLEDVENDSVVLQQFLIDIFEEEGDEPEDAWSWG